MLTSEDQQAILALVTPLVEEAATMTMQQAALSTPTTTWRPGTCVDVSTSSVASVVVDGDSTAIDVGVIGGAPAAGSRVMVIFVPPSAVFCFAMQPWNQAGGVADTVIVSADQTGITTIADLTGFSITFTALANRLYRVEYIFGASQVASSAEQVFNLYESATDLGIAFRQNVVVGLTTVSGFFDVPAASLAAGTRTLKLRGQTSAGSLTIPNATLINGRFAVEDIGPA